MTTLALLALGITLILAAFGAVNLLIGVDHRIRLRRVEERQEEHGEVLQKLQRDSGSCVLRDITHGPKKHESDDVSA